VRVLATDNGIPSRSATAIVIVDIRRNFQAPQWSNFNGQYSATIGEANALGVPFTFVTASDGDAQVRLHTTLIKHIRSIILEVTYNSDKTHS